MAVTEAILQAARNYLDITWEDPEGDKKLSGILARGMNYLNEIAGMELDFEPEQKPRELLFDYARYARANALEHFQKNFLHELLSLQIKAEVASYEGEDIQ